MVYLAIEWRKSKVKITDSVCIGNFSTKQLNYSHGELEYY